MYQTIYLKLSSDQKDILNPLDPTAMVSANRKAPPLERGKYNKIGGMWTLKHEISSQKFYELLIKTELKGHTHLYIKNFYNHTNMCFNTVTRLLKYLLPVYQFIKRYSEFAEYFIPDRGHPSYSWNVQI